jgi:hypothetical protein
VRKCQTNFGSTRRCPPEINQEERRPIIHFDKIFAREKWIEGEDFFTDDSETSERLIFNRKERKGSRERAKSLMARS